MKTLIAVVTNLIEMFADQIVGVLIEIWILVIIVLNKWEDVLMHQVAEWIILAWADRTSFLMGTDVWTWAHLASLVVLEVLVT